MLPSRTDAPTTSAISSSETRPVLAWQVHLLRRDPRRLPTLMLILFIAATCVWLMFRAFLPVLVALLLLVGAAGEYLFPIRYRITEEGVFADSPSSRLVLRWKEARRCLLGKERALLTPLPAPSRLDAFRGITLRFAPEGTPGDRASVLEALRRYAPSLLPQSKGESS